MGKMGIVRFSCLPFFHPQEAVQYPGMSSLRGSAWHFFVNFPVVSLNISTSYPALAKSGLRSSMYPRTLFTAPGSPGDLASCPSFSAYSCMILKKALTVSRNSSLSFSISSKSDMSRFPSMSW